GSGVIERNNDADYFSFSTQTGNISLTVNPFELGPNLDILAGLYNSAGQLITSSNPASGLSASITTTVTAGTYYLKVQGTGKGDPLATGYSSYGSLGQYEFTGTVVGGSGSPVLSVSDASVTEGGRMAFAVSLSQAPASDVTFRYTTQSGTATSGSDFSQKSGTFRIRAGQTTGTIYVYTTDDRAFEGAETMVLALSNVNGAVAVDGTATGTILDNDSRPTLSISDASIKEGGLYTSGKKKGKPRERLMRFTVKLSAPSGETVRVKYNTRNGTAKTSNRDYRSTSGILEFAPGETQKTITVIVYGDKRREAHETFKVLLSRAKGASLADKEGVGTIRNDDGKTLKSKKSSRAEFVDGDSEFDDEFDTPVAASATGTRALSFFRTARDEEQSRWYVEGPDASAVGEEYSSLDALNSDEFSVGDSSYQSSEQGTRDDSDLLDLAFAETHSLMQVLEQQPLDAINC
ncbi:MAG: hypothetical protein KDA85_01330, partial [Planctomycetaceae bacterium]|nr:hypothetical protein [Planctomycetaceae bacterium]